MDFLKKTKAIKLENGGRCVINEEDFDPKIHKPWTEKDEKAPKAVKAVPADAVEIPENWQGLKWSDKAKIAKAIEPGFKPDPKDRIGSSEAVIVAEIKRRAGE